MKTLFPVHTYRNLVVSLVLAISMVGVSYGAGGDMGLGTEPLTDGSAAYPWLIEDLADFDVFIGNSDYWDDYVKLECNLDLTGIPYTDALISHGSDFWGGDGVKYTGNFNGNGHVIENLTIDSTGTASGYVGLIGYAYPPGHIYDLGLENCTINAKGQYVGSLVGRNQSATIERCYAECNVTNTSAMTGGLVGECWGGSIEDCYTSGSVSGSSYVGGLLGRSNAEVRYSYSIATASGSSDVGGLVGDGSWGSVVMGFWDMTASGMTVSQGGYGRLTAEMKTAANYTSWDSGAWKIDEGIDYPRLVWENSTGTVINNVVTQIYPGTGTEIDPFIISSSDDLACLSKRPNDWGGYIDIANNIDMAGVTDFMPIASLGGTLNGNGYSIKNLSFDLDYTTSNIALISYAEYGSVIQDLGVEDADIDGPSQSAGIVGLNYGGTIERCFVSGLISGYNSVGGIAGKNGHGDIISCYNLADIDGNNWIGGITGVNFGDISDCYNEGDISGATSIGGLVGQNSDPLSNSYSIGQVSLLGNYGALVGYNNGEMTDCFWDTTVTGIAIGYSAASTGTATNVIGMATVLMQTESTFTDAGWDFDVVPVWRMPFELPNYPMLGWQKDVPGDFTGRYGVNMVDFAVLADTWFLSSGQAGYNDLCDLMDDDTIDLNDLAVFAENWLCD